MEIISTNASMITVTEKGYGKRTKVEEYRIQSRGGSGIIGIKVSEKNGAVVGVKQVTDIDDIMLVSDQGKVIRSSSKGVSTIGRATQGVRLINVDKGEKVVSLAKLAEGEDDGTE